MMGGELLLTGAGTQHGALGLCIFLTAARKLRRIGGGYTLAALCVGVGQGTGVVLERMTH